MKESHYCSSARRVQVATTYTSSDYLYWYLRITLHMLLNQINERENKMPNDKMIYCCIPAYYGSDYVRAKRAAQPWRGRYSD